MTLTTQFELAARLDPHVLVWLKLLDPAVIPMLVIAAAEVLTLLTVTCNVVLAVPENWREFVDNETLLPVPFKVTVCGLLLALSVIVSVPVNVVAEVGVKITGIVQLALAEIPVPQVLEAEENTLPPAVI